MEEEEYDDDERIARSLIAIGLLPLGEFYHQGSLRRYGHPYRIVKLEMYLNDLFQKRYQAVR